MSPTTPVKGCVPMHITSYAMTVDCPVEYHHWQIGQTCESVRQESAATKLPLAWSVAWGLE